MGNKTIVYLVDDDKTVRDAYKFFLESFGFAVEVAQSGPGLLKMLEWGLPDAVIVDYEMPIMNGIELLKQIKSNYPFLPTIMLTAHDDTDIGFDAAKAGAASFMVKPPDVNMLVDIIEIAVKRSHPANNG